MKFKKIFVTALVSVLALGNVMVFTQKSSAAVEETSLASVLNVNEALGENTTYIISGDSCNITITTCNGDTITVSNSGENKNIHIDNDNDKPESNGENSNDSNDSEFYKEVLDIASKVVTVLEFAAKYAKYF